MALTASDLQAVRAIVSEEIEGLRGEVKGLADMTVSALEMIGHLDKRTKDLQSDMTEVKHTLRTRETA